MNLLSTDYLHWIAERKHKDGTWHAVLSDDYCGHLMKASPFALLHNAQPHRIFQDTPQDFYRIIIGTRAWDTAKIEPVGSPDLPQDASDFAINRFKYPYFGKCHFKLQDLDDAISRLNSPIEAWRSAQNILVEKRARIEEMITGEDTGHYRSDHIIHGSSKETISGPHFPEMDQESNHSRLRREQHSAELLPISGNTLRFLLGYGGALAGLKDRQNDN